MTDDRLEQIIGGLLRAGVLSAAVVALAGGVWYLAADPAAQPQYSKFEPAVTGLQAFGVLPAPRAVILAGLLLLIAIPVARVAVTLVVFAIRKDRTYVAITLAVLVVLLYSLGTSWI